MAAKCTGMLLRETGAVGLWEVLVLRGDPESEPRRHPFTSLASRAFST